MKQQSCRSCRSPLELCSVWSLRVTSFAQQARKRSVDQKCQRLKIMSTFDSVQDRDLLPVYTVKSRNEPISANTNKLKSSNSLCHRAKPKHLEADAATGSWTCDNQRPVRRLDADTSWSETPVPEVQFSDEEADTTIVLHARHAHRNDSVMHSDTLTLRLMYLSYCLLIAKTWLGKGATWKREEAWSF